MKRILIFFLLFPLAAVQAQELSMAMADLIPKPVSVKAASGFFILNGQTKFFFPQGDKPLEHVAGFLTSLLNRSTGFALVPTAYSRKKQQNAVYLQIIKNDKLGNEGYILSVSKDRITLSANTAEGVFRGVQTLRQLLPPEIEKKTVQQIQWSIPAGTITDFPSYTYRGAMLDVVRHFFSVKDVKQYIDYLTAYKLNTLHLHLSDDQGWRVEIKSWPKLTEIGGSTEVGGGAGGFFTQEDYKELVRYAAERYITIIPEIDMPGHTNAALASYAELNCDGNAQSLYTGTDVGFSTLCVHKDITYRFIDDVIRELAAMTPGDYIHVGGDESHATPEKDYLYFVPRVQAIVEKHGKKVLGWDEIAHTRLNPNTIVEYWALDSNAMLAVQQGAKVLMAPGNKTYLDMQYHPETKLGLHWAGYVNVKDAYDWEPSKLVEGIGKKNIVGVESPLWTETITNMKDLEYMAFPRLAGHAEIGWTPETLRSWQEYKTRLGKHAARFEAMGINFYRSKLVKWNDKGK